MATEPRNRFILWICLAASAVLHGTFLVTIADPESALAKVLHTDTARDKPPKPRLGIDEGVPVSIAWIGFTEESPHAAVPAETLQPQLTADTMAAAFQSTQDVRQEAAQAANLLTESILTRMDALSELAAKVEQSQKKAEAKREAEARAAREAEPNPAQEPAPTPPTKQAIQDDRESDATSPTPVRSSDLGKVLARQGLRIQTFKPQFAATTKLHELRSRSGSVTAIIRFDQSGSVLHASLKPGTETGEASIDEPILDSVFRWRASGSEIDAIQGKSGAFVEVEINILF